MSQKTELEAALRRALVNCRGSHLTRESGERVCAKFSEFCLQAGFTHLREPSAIAGKHLRAFVLQRTNEGVSKRTLHNELAHLRKILRACGRNAVADAPELSNASLGLANASRKGTKTAMSAAQLSEHCGRALQQGRPGMAALLQLEFWLGLRGAEAIHARTDTLTRWLQELAASARIQVLAGTKGGRPRWVSIHQHESARLALEFALQTCGSQSGYLVVRKDGAPAGGLKQARAIYHAWAHRAGIEPHSARYAFAAEQQRHYLGAGLSPREALIAVSHDLGHGDGRGRWVRSVYLSGSREVTATHMEENRK